MGGHVTKEVHVTISKGKEVGQWLFECNSEGERCLRAETFSESRPVTVDLDYCNCKFRLDNDTMQILREECSKRKTHWRKVKHCNCDLSAISDERLSFKYRKFCEKTREHFEEQHKCNCYRKPLSYVLPHLFDTWEISILRQKCQLRHSKQKRELVFADTPKELSLQLSAWRFLGMFDLPDGTSLYFQEPEGGLIGIASTGAWKAALIKLSEDPNKLMLVARWKVDRRC